MPNDIYKLTQTFLSKVMPLEELARELVRSGGGTVALAHGCFDLLHIGHIRYLEAAERLGDTLIVTVTSDHFVNKGPGRPLFSEQIRAEVIAALRCTDYVAINDAPSAVQAIRLLRPSVFVKGPECRTLVTPGLLAEDQAIREVGGTMAYTDGEVWSSTEIMRRVMQL